MRSGDGQCAGSLRALLPGFPVRRLGWQIDGRGARRRDVRHHRRSVMAAVGKLALVGAGKMGAALLGGWLFGALDPRSIDVYEPQPADSIRELAAEKGFALNPQPSPADVVVLAIKPQMLDAAAPDLAPLFSPDSLLISILAGKTVANLSARLPAGSIVRAMPNTPAAIGRGITGAFASEKVTAAQRESAHLLLGGV